MSSHIRDFKATIDLLYKNCSETLTVEKKRKLQDNYTPAKRGALTGPYCSSII